MYLLLKLSEDHSSRATTDVAINQSINQSINQLNSLSSSVYIHMCRTDSDATVLVFLDTTSSSHRTLSEGEGGGWKAAARDEPFKSLGGTSVTDFFWHFATRSESECALLESEGDIGFSWVDQWVAARFLAINRKILRVYTRRGDSPWILEGKCRLCTALHL